MPATNSQKIFNVHSRTLQSCKAITGRQNEKYFVLALRSAEAFCQGFNPAKGTTHYGLTTQEASDLSEAQFEDLYRLLLSFYALALNPTHTPGMNAQTQSDTERVVGGLYFRKLGDHNSVDLTTLPVGFSILNYVATQCVVQIIRGRQPDLPQIRDTLDFTAYKMLEPALAKSARGGCFIATAVYGDEFHPNVILLQNFRDDSLSTTTAGRAFIAFYYRVGPMLAQFISHRATLHKLTLRILDSIVSALRKS